MYKSIKEYDRLNRLGEDKSKMWIVWLVLAIATLVLGLKVYDILSVNYCEDRPVGEVTYEQLMEKCIPGDGLSHKEYTGAIKNYVFLSEPMDAQPASGYKVFQDTRNPQ